jgi:isoamylase
LNHTAEGNERGPTYAFRGIDNTIYYLVDPDTGAYRDYTGCGNTLNCNHPRVRELIIDVLRYWVAEMHVMKPRRGQRRRQQRQPELELWRRGPD